MNLNRGYAYDNLTVADLKRKDVLERVNYVSSIFYTSIEILIPGIIWEKTWRALLSNGTWSLN